MEGAVWAEVDRAALAQELAAFARDPIDGRVRAVRGRRLIRTKYSPARQAERYRARLVDLGVLSEDAAAAKTAPAIS